MAGEEEVAAESLTAGPGPRRSDRTTRRSASDTEDAVRPTARLIARTPPGSGVEKPQGDIEADTVERLPTTSDEKLIFVSPLPMRTRDGGLRPAGDVPDVPLNQRSTGSVPRGWRFLHDGSKRKASNPNAISVEHDNCA